VKAMLFEKAGAALKSCDLPMPVPGPRQLLIAIRACGVCRTDLHIYEGDLSAPKSPLILGHEIVGIVQAAGAAVSGFSVGDRVGVPWLGQSCGRCVYCESGRENLCDRPGFTGYQIDGGYATHTLADAPYVFHIPSSYSDVHAAPLLCAGLIGYRAFRMTGDAQRIGFYGFGAAAHILAQIALYEQKAVYAFTRVHDVQAQNFAKERGATWAGDSETAPPQALDAAIIFAPVGSLVPRALKAVKKGGTVVCAGIHMSDIPSFSYDLLWGERVIRSVANLTRQDGIDFFKLASKVPIRTEVEVFPLSAADTALARLKTGAIQGAAVLCMKDEHTGS